MESVVVTINNLQNKRHFINLLKELKYVKSFDNLDERNVTETPISKKDWIKPGRKASKEEIEQLCNEMEKDKSEISLENSRIKVNNELEAWIKQQPK